MLWLVTVQGPDSTPGKGVEEQPPPSGGGGSSQGLLNTRTEKGHKCCTYRPACLQVTCPSIARGTSAPAQSLALENLLQRTKARDLSQRFQHTQQRRHCSASALECPEHHLGHSALFAEEDAAPVLGGEPLSQQTPGLRQPKSHPTCISRRGSI